MVAGCLQDALLEAGADPFAGETYFGGLGGGGAIEMTKMRVE